MSHFSISEYFKLLDNGRRQCLHCENKTYKTTDDEVLRNHILTKHPAIINTPLDSQLDLMEVSNSPISGKGKEKDLSLFNATQPQVGSPIAGSATQVGTSSSAMQPLSITEIQGLNTKQLIDYLRGKLPLDDDDLGLLTRNKLDGETFLDLTQEELERCGMAIGPAKKIIKYINQLKSTYQMESTESSPIQHFKIALKVTGRPRKPFPWLVNIDRCTVDDLKREILTQYEDEDVDEPTITIFVGDVRTVIFDDEKLRTTLKFFANSKIREVVVSLEQLSKAFTSFTFKQVCHIYGICDDSDPSIDVLPEFDCGATTIQSNHSSLTHLIEDLQRLKDTTQIQLENEATRSIYVIPFLVGAVTHFKDDIVIRPQKVLNGRRGHGPVDFALELRSTGGAAGVTEIKKEDLKKGIAQNAVQLEACLITRKKRKRDDIGDDTVSLKKSYGIVTDASVWYFLCCEKLDNGNVKHSLSKPFPVGLLAGVDTAQVKTVLESIVWLLGEMKKEEEEMQ